MCRRCALAQAGTVARIEQACIADPRFCAGHGALQTTDRYQGSMGPFEAPNTALLQRLRKLFVGSTCLALAVIAATALDVIKAQALTPFQALVPTLRNAPTPNSAAFILYFGVQVVLTPLVCLYICHKDPMNARLRYALVTDGGLNLRRAFFVYVIAVPVIVGLLYFALNLPAHLFGSEEPATSGAQAIRVLARSHLALLLLGPVLTIGIWLLLYMVLISFSIINVVRGRTQLWPLCP